MSIAQLARTPVVAALLLVVATFSYSIVPSLNFFANGSDYPLLLTGLMRLGFSAGILVLLFALYRPLLSRKGLAVVKRVARSEWKLIGLAMLTTWDVALFSLAYRFMDISIATAMTAMVPASNVVFLALLNKSWLTWRQKAGLLLCMVGALAVMWAGGFMIETDRMDELWNLGIGVALGLGMVACGGLTVSALRLGEILAIEWYWEELGTGAGMVWGGSMLVLALAQGVTAPLFLALAIPAGIPSVGALGLMLLMGLAVLLGTALWALANGSGLRPMVNGLGYLQPGWALLILVVLGIAGAVNWVAMVGGLALIVAANALMQIWGGRDY